MENQSCYNCKHFNHKRFGDRDLPPCALNIEADRSYGCQEHWERDEEMANPAQRWKGEMFTLPDGRIFLVPEASETTQPESELEKEPIKSAWEGGAFTGDRVVYWRDGNMIQEDW